MFRTCVYYPNWSFESHQQLPQEIPNLKHTTNIFYSFITTTDDGNLIDDSEASNVEYHREKHSITSSKKITGLLGKLFEFKIMNPGIRVSMSIGGWSNREHFTNAMNSEQTIAVFIKSAISFMMQYGFDGIDLDWEYPETKEDITTYYKLMKSLRKEMDKLEQKYDLPNGSFLLTIATPADTERLENWPIAKMDKYLSFWNLMTYDIAGEWSENVGYHCNLYSIPGSEECADDTVNFFIEKGVERKKLVLGMAAYGRSFNETDGVGKGIVNYKHLPTRKAEESFDSKAIVAWCYSKEKKVFVSYDNLESCLIKGKYVKKLGLGGGMWWESTGLIRKEEKGLVREFVKGIGGIEDLKKEENLIDCFRESEFLKKNGFF